MIDRGLNPFVASYTGLDDYENCNRPTLSNLPTKKSIYFTTQPLIGEFKDTNDFPDPWFYRTGVFGKFDSVIGRGASGVVLSGDWFGRKAAFKFVDIGIPKIPDSKNVQDAIEDLNRKLSEMISIQSTKGSKIVSFYGHYR